MTGPWAKPEMTRLGWEPFAAGPGPVKDALDSVVTSGSNTASPITRSSEAVPRDRPQAPGPAGKPPPRQNDLFLN
jgi:hypothetical protein